MPGIRTRYAKAGDLHIAYRLDDAGAPDGAVDLVLVPGFVSNVELADEMPGWAAVRDRLRSFTRLVTFDKRGTGLSDRFETSAAPHFEERMDDIRAVMDAAGSERAVLWGTSEGGPLALLFAATHPDRVAGLILYSTAPFFSRLTPDLQEQFEQAVETTWGSGAVTAYLWGRDLRADPAFRSWASRAERQSASPGTVIQLMRLNREVDVSPVLPTISAPTLVVHHVGDPSVPIEDARAMAAAIPGARMLEVPGATHAWGDTQQALDIVGEVEEFITGSRRADPEPADRILATLLVTDIVGSTATAARLGDAEWRRLLDRHDAVVRQELERHRGVEVKHTGDGFLARFDGPARAVRAAQAITRATAREGCEVRAGVHTGECELRGRDLGGIAVHIAARVGALAQANQVLVSQTVRDLVAGSGLTFADAGTHELKGVSDEWRLYEATATATGSAG
jgi:class 3 adenylate cyclase/alpha-beta hydrolase superfamily lysophospholipase